MPVVRLDRCKECYYMYTALNLSPIYIATICIRQSNFKQNTNALITSRLEHINLQLVNISTIQSVDFPVLRLDRVNNIQLYRRIQFNAFLSNPTHCGCVQKISHGQRGVKVFNLLYTINLETATSSSYKHLFTCVLDYWDITPVIYVHICLAWREPLSTT